MLNELANEPIKFLPLLRQGELVEFEKFEKVINSTIIALTCARLNGEVTQGTQFLSFFSSPLRGHTF